MAQAGGRNVLRSLSRDEDYRDHQVKPGTYRRVLQQAAPFRSLIALFITTIVVISALGVAPALLFRAIIDDGVLAGNLDVVIWLAVVVAVMALVSAGLQLVETTDGATRPVDSQLRSGSPDQLAWVLDGTTAAGSTRTFEVVEVDQRRLVLRNPDPEQMQELGMEQVEFVRCPAR